MSPMRLRNDEMGNSGSFNFSERPFLVIWETTRACDLACVHCRASADPHPAPDELNQEEGKRLVEGVHEMGTPILIFSGGDCLKRPDLTKLIAYAKSLGLRTGAIPAVTSNLTEDRLKEFKEAGLDQIAFSLDAAKAEDHDAFRRAAGIFERTLQCVEKANQIGLRVQINSLINVHNQDQLEELVQLIQNLNIVFWEVFFLVPTGRGQEIPLMSAEKFEEAFGKIYELQEKVVFIIKVTEAPHYRRFFYEQEMKKQGFGVDALGKRFDLPEYLRRISGPRGGIGRAPAGVNSGKGFMFISYRGDVMPSGFLPIATGNIRKESLAEIYRNAPLFQELRDTSRLKGRCGICFYKEICGGSRARAYAMTGDYLDEDPCCAYQPSVICASGGRI